MKNILKRFDVRVIVAVVVTILCVVVLSDFLIFRFIYNRFILMIQSAFDNYCIFCAVCLWFRDIQVCY